MRESPETADPLNRNDIGTRHRKKSHVASTLNVEKEASGSNLPSTWQFQQFKFEANAGFDEDPHRPGSNSLPASRQTTPASLKEVTRNGIYRENTSPMPGFWRTTSEYCSVNLTTVRPLVWHHAWSCTASAHPVKMAHTVATLCVRAMQAQVRGVTASCAHSGRHQGEGWPAGLQHPADVECLTTDQALWRGTVYCTLYMLFLHSSQAL